jgi:acetate kinase
MMAAMGGIDALAFTGGIGEHAAPVRAGIMDGLAWTGLRVDTQANARNAPRLHDQPSAIEAWIVPADEERTIALDVLHALEAAAPSS